MKTLVINSKITIDTDIQAVLDVCKNVVQTLKSELIFNQDGGIAYVNVVWVGSPNIAQIESILFNALRNVDNVLSITSLTAFVQNNILTYNATIQTAFGEGNIGL
jgi:hypothetical protein